MHTELEAKIGNTVRRAIELLCGMATLGLGSMFINNNRAFWPGQPLHSLQDVAPADFWGLIFVVFGTIRLTALVINGVWPLGPTVRWTLSIASLTLMWCPLTFGYWYTLPDSSGLPGLIYSALAVAIELVCLFALSALRAGRGHGR